SRPLYTRPNQPGDRRAGATGAHPLDDGAHVVTVCLGRCRRPAAAGALMSKPICLITGATDGIGKVTATALARNGYAVVLAARNETKAATVTTEIVASTGNRAVDYLITDLR